MKPQMQAQLVSNGEGAMARADLYRAAKNAMKLFQMVQEDQELEGWVQAKITKSADYLDSVYHYMEYKVKFGGGATATSLDDITGDSPVASSKNEVSEEDDETPIEMEESMNYEQRLHALLEGAKKKAMMKPAKKDEKVKEGKTEVQYDKDGKRTGVKHTSTHKYTDEPHTEPKSQVKSKSAAEKAGEKAADKKQAKDSKDYEKKNPGSVTRYKDGKKVSNEGVMDTVKSVAKKVGKAITGPDDEELLKDLQKKVGVPQTGKKPGVKEADETRAPAKKKERTDTLPSGAKVKTTTVQGWQSQKADKAANKDRKDSYKAEGSKPDFLDMDKDGDKKEPMKKAVADKKAGPKKGVNPFAKKNESVEVAKEVVTESADLTRMKQFLTRLNG
jgi:hypothetical protein